MAPALNNMCDPNHPLFELLSRDKRYRFDAYIFVFEALRYAQEELGMGEEYETPAEEATFEGDSTGQGSFSEKAGEKDAAETEEWEGASKAQRHVTGQELCEAMRRYAVEQYGYLAKSVLNHWGVRSTGDFGEIVFNLIEVEQMRKTPEDRREDFENVYDFDEAFQYSFEFSSADSSEEPRF